MFAFLMAAMIGSMDQPEYSEILRPQFHFTSRINWLNDPNGLVYYDGTYHLFFQHNPTGIGWGNMHWGHATSVDLVHWKQKPIALKPDSLGAMFSGSAVVDWDNTAGFQTGDDPTIVLIYTAAGEQSTQCLAYSNDKGKTWTKYAGNPALPEGSRDPKVFRYKKKWIMTLYRQENGVDGIKLYSSADLKSWEPMSFIPGFYECPDMFELAVDGKKRNRKWVVLGASGKYLIGSFNGKIFTPESEMLTMDYGGNFYASQTYSDIPASDGRRIQIAWMNGGQYPDMPFNQQMSFPCELTIKTGPNGLQVNRMPVKEIKSLYGKRTKLNNTDITMEKPVAIKLSQQEIDLAIELELGDAAEICLTIGDQVIKYRRADSMVTCLGREAVLVPVDNRIKLRILVDRASIELFGNDGQVSMSTCYIPAGKEYKIECAALGGRAKLKSLNVYELKSAWVEK